MPLKLTITDPSYGTTITDAIHIIAGIINSDGKAKSCQIKMEVYDSLASIAAGRHPIAVGKDGSRFFVINCIGEDFDTLTLDLVTEEDVGLTIRQAQLNRAEAWIHTLDATKAPFDYTQAVII